MRILFILYFFFFVVIYRSITYTSRQIMSRPIGEHNRFVAYLKRSFLDKLKKKKTTISFLCVVISNRGHSKFVCRFGIFFFFCYLSFLALIMLRLFVWRSSLRDHEWFSDISRCDPAIWHRLNFPRMLNRNIFSS